jgi:hypothetical protein
MFVSNNCLEAAGPDNITEKLMRRRLTFALAAADFVGNPVLLAYAQAPPVGTGHVGAGTNGTSMGVGNATGGIGGTTRAGTGGVSDAGSWGTEPAGSAVLDAALEPELAVPEIGLS